MLLTRCMIVGLTLMLSALARTLVSQPRRRAPRDRATGEPLPPDRRLIINDVLKYAAEDSERIGIYSFNKARSERTGQVRGWEP